mgnify:FL=1
MKRVKINDPRLQEIGTSRPNDAGTQQHGYGVHDAQRDVGVLAEVGQENQNRSRLGRNLSYGALGTAALAGVIGAGAYFGQSGNSEKITSLDNRVTNTEQRISTPVDTMMIRNYALNDGVETCEDAPSWYAIGDDCKTNVDNGTSGNERYDGLLRALNELDLKGDYKLDNAHFKVDHSRNPIPIDSNTRPLESILSTMFSDSGNDNGLIYWLTNPNAPEPASETTSYTPTTKIQQKQCGTDVVDVLRRGFLGAGRIDKTGRIDDCQGNYTSGVANFIGDICSNGYTVNGSFTQNPAQYITQLNGDGGESQHFEVRCQPREVYHHESGSDDGDSSGRTGNTDDGNGGNPKSGRGDPGSRDAGRGLSSRD